MALTPNQNYTIISNVTCLHLPPNVNSKSMFVTDKINGSYWLNSSMPRFEVIAVLTIVLSQLCHFVLQRFGLPMFVSQLIAGRILAMTIMEYQLKITDQVIMEEGIKVLATMATIGYASSVFQIGVKVDLKMIRRAGKTAVYLGCFSVVVSFLGGLLVSFILFETYEKVYDVHDRFLFPVLTTSVTSFPVVTFLLNDLKIVNSELGRLGQSAALISDTVSMFFINSVILARVYTQAGGSVAIGLLGFIVGLLCVVVFIIRPTMKWIVRQTPTNGRVKDVYIYGIICIFLGFTSLSRWFPQFIMGPNILGLAIPTGPPLGSVIAEKFDGLTSGIFMPLFIATCSMRMDFSTVDGLQAMQVAGDVSIIALTFLAKFGVCFAILVYAKFPKKDGCALALIMCTKGVVELATVSFMSDSQLVNHDSLCLMSLAVVVIASFTPILVKTLYDPSTRYTVYERRTVMHLARNSNLQILTCIHVPNHISAVTNLLEASGASEKRPIGIHVLHLIKLRGQAAPEFISHNSRKMDFSGNHSYSENVVISFSRFESNNRGAISVNVFTTISEPNHMYEDVCTLALEQSASLIILPFHRRWYLDGSVESDDNSIQVLNRMVLETAPCSVGILVDRGSNRRLTSIKISGDLTQNVAMIFLGGNDDREALVYAMRMAKDPNIRLTVARFISANGTATASIDTEVLKTVKSNKHIRYMEHKVKDGPETALIIRSMMKEFEFFIVGRADNLECQQTIGLNEWMDYPELGIIGDMFTTSDMGQNFSALIVQQQRLSHLTTS